MCWHAQNYCCAAINGNVSPDIPFRYIFRLVFLFANSSSKNAHPSSLIFILILISLSPPPPPPLPPTQRLGPRRSSRPAGGRPLHGAARLRLGAAETRPASASSDHSHQTYRRHRGHAVHIRGKGTQLQTRCALAMCTFRG